MPSDSPRFFFTCDRFFQPISLNSHPFSQPYTPTWNKASQPRKVSRCFLLNMEWNWLLLLCETIEGTLSALSPQCIQLNPVIHWPLPVIYCNNLEDFCPPWWRFCRNPDEQNRFNRSVEKECDQCHLLQQITTLLYKLEYFIEISNTEKNRNWYM